LAIRRVADAEGAEAIHPALAPHPDDALLRPRGLSAREDPDHADLGQADRVLVRGGRPELPRLLLEVAEEGGGEGVLFPAEDPDLLPELRVLRRDLQGVEIGLAG